ncbi:MAG: hypothetical protein ACX939_09590 [Hyphococcus sp.]
MSMRQSKLAILGATALTVATAGFSTAHAFALDQAAAPQTVETAGVLSVAHDVAQDEGKPTLTAKRLGLVAAAGAVLAALYHGIGPKKVARAVRATATRAVEATTATAAAAASGASRALRSPIRFLAWMAGLFLFSLTGVALFDIEWIGGLIAGAGITGLFAAMMVKARAVLRPVAIRAKQKSNMDNGN